MVTIPDIIKATEPMRRRAEAQMKKASPLYREVRNMPPPQGESLVSLKEDAPPLYLFGTPNVEMLPGQIYISRPEIMDGHDPYAWFTPRR